MKYLKMQVLIFGLSFSDTATAFSLSCIFSAQQQLSVPMKVFLKPKCAKIVDGQYLCS